MKKPTTKNQLQEANDKISRIFYDMYRTIGGDKVLAMILAGYEEDLLSLDKDIENEQGFADENPAGSTYGSAGSDARRQVKYLKKARLEQVKLIDMFKSFIKQKIKTDKLW